MWRKAKHTFTPTKLTTLREDQIDLFNQSRYPTYISHACQELLQFKIGCINFIRSLQKQKVNTTEVVHFKIQRSLLQYFLSLKKLIIILQLSYRILFH